MQTIQIDEDMVHIIIYRERKDAASDCQHFVDFSSSSYDSCYDSSLYNFFRKRTGLEVKEMQGNQCSREITEAMFVSERTEEESPSPVPSILSMTCCTSFLGYP